MYWDSYGLYAQGSFDSLPSGQTISYAFRIYRKAYKGAVKSTLCGQDAIILRYLADQPNPPIKGSEIELNLINFENTMPLSNFYSEEDDTYKIQVDSTYLIPDVINPGFFISETKRIFEGFLVQEDCEEELTDFSHNIRLVFTDNLGILKDISFNDANKVSAPLATDLRQDIMAVAIIEANYPTGLGWRLYVSKTTGSPQVGDFVTVQRAGAANGTYEILKIQAAPATTGYWLYIKENPPGVVLTSTSALVTYITPSDISWRISIADCVRICLMATNIPLEIYYMGNLLPVLEATVYPRFMENTYIDARTFLQDSNWDSCYTVLEKIGEKFGLTICQADGVWMIIRWHELRYYNNGLIAYKYDQYMTYFGSQSPYTKEVSIGAGEDVEAGAKEILIRPYQNYTEKLQYTQIPNALYNGNMMELGAFVRRRSFNTDGQDYYAYEYEALNYELMPGLANTYEVHIHVIKKQGTEEEVERFLRIQQVSGTPVVERKVIRTNPIEVNKGDRLKISWQHQSWNTGGANIYTFLQVEKGTSASDKYFVNGVKNDDDLNGWKDLPSFSTISPNLSPPARPSSSFSTAFLPESSIVPRDLNTITVETQAIPFDGIFYMYLGCNSISNPALQDFKGLSVEITTMAADLNRLGHENKAFISKAVKNKLSQDIYMDNTLKNFYKGTLFMDAFINQIQIKALEWQDGQTLGKYTLGYITTRQEELWRDKIRSKVELKFWPLINADYKRPTIYNVILFAPKAGKSFIFGKADFNLRENFVQGTIFEMWKTGEDTGQGVADVDIKYEQKFLYK